MIDAHRGAPVSPALLARSGEPIIPLQPRSVLPRPCRTVFGYLPYWESPDNVRYDLLTHLACFRVRVNSNGFIDEDAGWPWTAVINDAHQAGVKVILTITLFDGHDVHTLLTNEAHKAALFVTIRDLLLAGNADGVNIDFEDKEYLWAGLLPGFMADLTTYLHAEIPGSEVTTTGPIINWNNQFDLAALAANCDGIFIMGYNFYGPWSSTSGPGSPLTGGNYNLTDTVENQYAAVTQNSPEKLILGLPYYGVHWKTVSNLPYSPRIEFIDHTYFRDTYPESLVHGVQWDANSQTPWYTWHDGQAWHQVWFDNTDSLLLKYQLATSHDYQGVGIWALGYDGEETALWDLLENEFAGCETFADFNHDGRTDTADLDAFLSCMTGPAVTYPEGDPCLLGDADDDRDVDTADYSAFMQHAAPPE